MQSSSLLNRLYNKIQSRPKLFLYTPLILYWFSLFMGTTLPTDKIPQLFNAQDKFEHLLGYFGLAVLVSLWLHFQKRWQLLRQKAYLFSFLIVTIYAALDEIHQLFIPGRDCDVLDWIADSLGALAGIFLIYLFIKFSTRNQITVSAST